MVDITESKTLEEELRQAQKMEAVGRLAGGVAHDFNNLLTIIDGYTQLALASLDSTVKLSEHLNEVQKASQRAAALHAASWRLAAVKYSNPRYWIWAP